MPDSQAAYRPVFLSLGSNIGRRRANCLAALNMLAGVDGINILDTSPFYLTEPVDYTEQDWFVNGAVKIGAGIGPFELLAVTQEIQEACGRRKTAIRFGPRALDIDIIFFGDEIISGPGLTIPHPRMHKRRFVLQPICDIDPTVVHPLLGQTVRELLSKLDPGTQRMVPC